ncbi:MAG TPA: hypothetical protein VJA23_01310 [Candidatus Nanoarchaeia archaeon]|nr:hypothetical protein [Candidatus Nanoarchaeia archaeon]
MGFIKIRDENSAEFRGVWGIYESSFPSDERRTMDLQKKLIKNKRYSFFSIVIKDKK